MQETSSRWDKVVILRHMFTLQELEEDPAAILDIKEDIREECSKLGPVTNVVLFDKEEAGVASVRFGNEEAANACVRVSFCLFVLHFCVDAWLTGAQLMDGRMFAGEKVQAHIATGNEKFKRSGEKKSVLEGDGDSEGEEGKRLDEFGKWLEEEAEGES